MKFSFTYFSLLLCALCNSVAAAPVLNRSAPAGERIMVYVDHLDPNLYYLSPETIDVQRSEDGTPLFSYLEYYDREGGSSRKSALIQTLLSPTFNAEKIESAKSKILATNPKALFAVLPFIESSIALNPEMQSLVKAGSCKHGAGSIDQAVSCTIALTPQGHQVIGGLLKAGKEINVQFNYLISGMTQLPDGTYASDMNEITIAGAIGGKMCLEHPEIFQATEPTSVWPH